MSVQVSVEIRHDNIVYKCHFCEATKSYDGKEKVYSVSFIKGCLPSPQGMQVIMEGVMCCPDCWEERKKSGIFKEPSGIVIPEPKLPPDFMKK